MYYFFSLIVRRDKYRDVEREREYLSFFIKVNHISCACVVVSRLVSDLAVHKTEKVCLQCVAR